MKLPLPSLSNNKQIKDSLEKINESSIQNKNILEEAVANLFESNRSLSFLVKDVKNITSSTQHYTNVNNKNVTNQTNIEGAEEAENRDESFRTESLEKQDRTNELLEKLINEEKKSGKQKGKEGSGQGSFLGDMAKSFALRGGGNLLSRLGGKLGGKFPRIGGMLTRAGGGLTGMGNFMNPMGMGMGRMGGIMPAAGAATKMGRLGKVGKFLGLTSLIGGGMSLMGGGEATDAVGSAASTAADAASLVPAKPATGVAKGATKGGGLFSKLGSKIPGKGLLSGISGILGKGKGLFGKLGGKLAGGLGKSLLKKIPGVGLLAGLGFGVSRLMSGDWKGALGEVASGAASLIPGIGTAASAAIDAGMMARDMMNDGSEEKGKETEEQKMPDVKDMAQASADKEQDKLKSLKEGIETKVETTKEAVATLDTSKKDLNTMLQDSSKTEVPAMAEPLQQSVEAQKSDGIGFKDILSATPMGGMFNVGSKLLSGEMPDLKDIGSALIPGFGAFNLASKAFSSLTGGDSTQAGTPESSPKSSGIGMMDIFKATPMGGMFNVGSKLLSGEMPGIKDIAGAMIPGFGALDLAYKTLSGGDAATSQTETPQTASASQGIGVMDILKATPMGGMFNVGSKLLSGEMPGIKDIAGAMIPGFGALDLASKVLGGGTPAQSPAAQAGGTKPEAGKSGIGLTDILKSTPMGGMFSIGSKLLSGEMPNMKDLATAFVPGYGAFDLASKALMGDTTQTKVADGTKPTTATTEKTTQPIPVQIVGGSATKETLSGTMADKSIFDKISDALFSKPKEQKSFNIVNNTSTTQVGGAMTTTPQSIRENVQITEPILLSAVRNDLSYM